MQQFEEVWDTKKRKYTDEVGRILQRELLKWLNPQTHSSMAYVPKEGIQVKSVTLTQDMMDPKGRILIGYKDNSTGVEPKNLLELKYDHLQDFLEKHTTFKREEEKKDYVPEFSLEKVEESEGRYTEDQFNEFMEKNVLQFDYEARGRINFVDADLENGKIILAAYVEDRIFCRGSSEDFQPHLRYPLWLPDSGSNTVK